MFNRSMRSFAFLVVLSLAALTFSQNCLSLVDTKLSVSSSAPTQQARLQGRCWAKYTDARTRIGPQTESQEVSFANIESAMRVYSPFRVHFAIRGMGIAPAGKPLAGVGHHHLLINKKLPTDVLSGLPFDQSHRHFGKGETSALLDLPTGSHTLRLLFADHEHKPYYVFSKEIRIEVAGPRSLLIDTDRLRIDDARFDETCRNWYANEVTRPEPAGTTVFFQNIRDGEVLRSKFTARFGVEGFGVCSQALQVEKTGHVIVAVLKNGRVVQEKILSRGETQTDFSLSPGSYELSARLRDHKGTYLSLAHSIGISVKPQ
jgi:hypothetical protein